MKNWDVTSNNSPKDKNGNPLLFLNVGSGNEITIKDLAELIAREMKFKGKILWDDSKPDGTPRKVLNIEKLKTLGWESSIDLKDGIKDAIFDFQNNNVRM